MTASEAAVHQLAESSESTGEISHEHELTDVAEMTASEATVYESAESTAEISHEHELAVVGEFTVAAVETIYQPLDRLRGFGYCINSNPRWGEAVALGFQHFLLALGMAVMIPNVLVHQMGGDIADKVRVIQTLLFVTGVNTLLQTLLGTRLPTVMGGSFAFMVPTLSIIHDPSLTEITDDYERFLQTMRIIQGALIVSSSMQIVIGYSRLWGICTRFFSPVAMVPLVALVGIGPANRGYPVYLKHVQAQRTPMFERFALLISIAIIWTYAELLTAGGAYKERQLSTQIDCQTDRANLISNAPWIRIPYPLQWGQSIFNARHALGMTIAALVCMIESTGAYSAAARLASATPPPGYVLSRGIGCQGIGILISGFFGTSCGSTVSVENVGFLGSTRIGSRRVIQISGKFGALFTSIPLPIFAAAYCILFGIVAATGLSFLQFTNINSMRNLFIVGASSFLGISVKQYYHNHVNIYACEPIYTKAGWFNDFINTVIYSPPAVALFVAVLLDNTFDFRNMARERGMQWWRRFHRIDGDMRNAEFYSLPFNRGPFLSP